MKRLMILITLLTFFFNFTPCFAKGDRDRATIYNDKWEKQYTVEKHGNETRVYDKEYKVKYHIKDGKIYDKEWKTKYRYENKSNNYNKKD